MSTRVNLGDMARRAGLDLLVLFGSRARGEERPDSDWDLAYLAPQKRAASAPPAFDIDSLLAEVVLVLGTDRIDLVDLRTASGLLRQAVASEGRTVFEARPGLFQEFQIEAARFWCDAGPVLEASYAIVLDALGPR